VTNIAIVIPTHNRCEDLRNVLDQIYNQRIVGDIKLYPIVIIDGSSDGTKEMINNFYPHVVQIFGDGSWWYTKSINEGIRYSLKNNFDFILTMNDDCLIDENYVSTILSDQRTLPSNSILGSISFSIEQPTRVIFSGVKQIIWWRYKNVHYLKEGTNVSNQKLQGIYKTFELPGRGILIPIHVFDKIGIFNEKFVQYGSDTEFIYRSLEYNVNVFISWNAKIYTYLSKTGKGSIYAKESLITFLKNYFDKYSRNYIPNIARIIWNYGYKLIIPVTLIVKILGQLKNHFRNEEI
jgi:GT2 family glycosyltransferase